VSEGADARQQEVEAQDEKGDLGDDAPQEDVPTVPLTPPRLAQPTLPILQQPLTQSQRFAVCVVLILPRMRIELEQRARQSDWTRE
jgi:hypothetical protein